jgi:hypothetical protein
VLDDIAFQATGADRPRADPTLADQHPRARAPVRRAFDAHDGRQGAAFPSQVCFIERFDYRPHFIHEIAPILLCNFPHVSSPAKVLDAAISTPVPS